MDREKILNLSKKNIEKKEFENLKEYLKKNNYDISYGKYESLELKKAIVNEKKPIFIKNNFLVGHEKNNIFINDKNEKIKIDKMVKAIIVEDEIIDDIDDQNEIDPFIILGENEWVVDLTKFNSIFGNLDIKNIFLPPHSAVFNFLNQTDKEKKDKIVSCLSGININLYDKNNYIENAMHEVGHLFWRDCLNYNEKNSFKKYFKRLNPSAIYEYDWERENEEEMFCTIYKWYLKSILLNKSFYNILEHEEKEGLGLLLDVFERIAKDREIEDIWELKKNDLYTYLNPAFDKTTGKRIVKQGLYDSIKDVKIPESIVTKNVQKMEKGIVFVELNNKNIPIENNKVNWEEFEKAKRMPIGTISKGRKKIAERKWVKVSNKKEKKQNKKIIKEKPLDEVLKEKNQPFEIKTIHFSPDKISKFDIVNRDAIFLFEHPKQQSAYAKFPEFSGTKDEYIDKLNIDTETDETGYNQKDVELGHPGWFYGDYANIIKIESNTSKVLDLRSYKKTTFNSDSERNEWLVKNIEEFKNLDPEEDESEINELIENFYDSPQEKQINKYAKKIGFDMVLYDDSSEGDPYTSIAVVNPEIIKKSP